jgi:PEP-CTERM motif
LATSALVCATSQAAPIATYDLAPYNGDTTLEATSVSAGFNASAISAVGVTGGSFSNHFYFSGWGAALDTSKYFSVTIGSSSGDFFLDRMLFSAESTSTVPATAVVRSSLDGYTSDIDSFTWGDPQATVTNGDFDLSGLGQLSSPVNLRIYFSTTAGNVGFANHQLGGTGGGLADTGRDITFEGRQVPEPHSMALLALAGLGVAGTTRLRKKAEPEA